MKRCYKWLLILLVNLAADGAAAQESTFAAVNLAAGGAVIQSSTFADGYAEKAVDGIHDTMCTETVYGSDPWWRLDLGDVYCVNRVVINNRLDCCPENIDGAEIHVGNSLVNNGNDNPLCAVIPSIPAGESYTYSCEGMAGRYVNLFLPGTEKILTLCEVEVYGEVNLAAGGAVTQSSTYADGYAEKAVDGIHDTMCTETVYGSDPWWRLDLGDVYCVNRVVINNRLDCCPENTDGAEIHVGNSLVNNGNDNPLCAVIPAIQSYTYSCQGMVGRYVNVLLPGTGKVLMLCEVEVYKDDVCLKRSLVKMQFNSESDLTDPTMRNNLLQQLGSALHNRGFENVTVQWSQTPRPEVIPKVTGRKRCSEGK